MVSKVSVSSPLQKVFFLFIGVTIANIIFSFVKVANAIKKTPANNSPTMQDEMVKTRARMFHIIDGFKRELEQSILNTSTAINIPLDNQVLRERALLACMKQIKLLTRMKTNEAVKWRLSDICYAVMAVERLEDRHVLDWFDKQGQFLMEKSSGKDASQQDDLVIKLSNITELS